MRRVLFLAAVLFPGAVMAQTVTYEFAGTIDTINFNDNDVFPEGYDGQPFSGWFSYSSDSHTTQIGAITFSIGSFQSTVIDERLIGFEDLTELILSYYGTQGDYDFGRTGLSFTDHSGQAFDNDNQLLTVLTLDMFDEVEFSIQGSKTQDNAFMGNFDLRGQVDTLTLVPEPATALLMLVGGFCLRRK